LLYRRTERELLELMADHSFTHETKDRGFALRRYRCTESPEIDAEFNYDVTGLDVEVMDGCPVACCAIVFSMGEKRIVPCMGRGLYDFRSRVVQAMYSLESNPVGKGKVSENDGEAER
jgi:hypothetical protein